MKKYIFIALIVFSIGVAQPVRAMHLSEPTRQEIMIQLIATLTELVKQLQAQLAIALQKEAKVLPPVTVTGSANVTQEATTTPYEVNIVQGGVGHYSLGGNCDQVVFTVNKPSEVYSSETKSWFSVTDRLIYRPQSTSTKITFVFTSGSQRVDQWLDVGEAVDRSATTGQPFDYQLGKCK